MTLKPASHSKQSRQKEVSTLTIPTIRLERVAKTAHRPISLSRVHLAMIIMNNQDTRTDPQFF